MKNMNKTNKQIIGAMALALILTLAYASSQAGLFSQNTVSVSGLLITFDDGSTQTIHKGTSMTLIDSSSGRTVKSISTIVAVNPVYSGNLASYDFSGMSSFLFIKSAGNLVNLGMQTMHATGSSLASGQSTNVIVGTSDASTIDSLVRSNGGVNGIIYSFRLHAETPMSLTLTFTNGNQQTKTYNLPDSDWNFRLS
jgi:hypothetical protein